MPHRKTLRRLAQLILVAGLLVAGQVGGAGPASAAHLWDGVLRAHPYSNPLWWPLNASGTAMACYHGNGPDCRHPLQHKVYAMDVAAPNNSRLAVYSMGAGVVHIGSKGWRCSTKQSRGNWLYVDHGNGVRSEYGHLGTIYVHDGDMVTARTKLATVGQSGYSRCASKPYVRYLWLAVRHGSSYHHFTSSYTCVHGTRVRWPQQLPGHATDDWNKVPAHTVLPASDRSCAPDTPPTPVKPVAGRLTRHGAGELHLTWHRARAADYVRAVSVQFQEYHPRTHRWGDFRTHRLRATATATTFTHLPEGRKFRARVWMANTTGWSAPSYWHRATS